MSEYSKNASLGKCQEEGKRENKDAERNDAERDMDNQKAEQEVEEKKEETLSEYGQMTLDDNEQRHRIHLLSIIGEVEGHENMGSGSKTTKYEHVATWTRGWPSRR